MATAKNSLAPIIVGLLLLVVVGGGAFWLINSDAPPAEKPPVVEAPKAAVPEPVKPAGDGQRTALSGSNIAFDTNVKVKVVDLAGQPIPNAQVETYEMVEVYEPLGQPVATYQTGANGVAEIKGSMKTAYMISAQAPRLVKAYQQIKTAVKETSIELLTGGTLTVSVQDAETKKPLPAMMVQMAAELGGKPNLSIFRWSEPTSDQGTVSVAPVPQVPLELVVNHPDYDLFDEQYKVGSTENKNLTVLLRKRITLEGVVLSAADGKPIEGADVKVAEGTAPNVSEMLGLSDKHVAKAKTDASGHFKVEKCPVGTLYIDASHPDFVLSSRGPEESDQLIKSPMVFKLDRNASIHGQVVDSDEKPIEGASIVAIFAQNPFFEQQLAEERKKAPKSGADGSFVLPSVQPSVEWKIHALHPDYLETVTEVFKLGPGERREGFVIHLAMGGTISGLVKDSAGNPLKDAEVVAVLVPSAPKAGATRMPAVKSGDDGTFAVKGLLPGMYMLETALDGFCKEFKPGVRHNANGVDVTMLKEAIVTGVILSSNDRSPVPEFQVRYRASGSLVPQGSATMSARSREGKFQIRGLRPGLYDLEVKAADFAPTMVTGVAVSEGATSGPIEILLGQGSSLEGLITQITREPINRALVELDPLTTFDAKDKDYVTLRAACDPEGHYNIGKLLPGKYRLTVTHPKFANIRPLDIEINAGVNRQDVVLQQGATVSVYVRDAAGDPLAGMRVILRDKARQYMSAPGNRVKLRKDTPFMISDGPGGGGSSAHRVTDKNGFIQFKRQDAGEYELVVSGERYQTFRKDMTIEYEKQYVETVSIQSKEKQ